MGVSPVTSSSDDFDLECVWRCHDGSASESQDPRLFIAVYVEPEDKVDFGILHYSVLNHRLRSSPSAVLFRGLKEKLHSPDEFALVIRELFGCSEERCYVSIVTTCRPHSVLLRADVNVGTLLSRKSIPLLPECAI